MKTIKEYINNDNWQPTLRPENSNEYFYEQLEDFYGEENIPNKYIELFENRILYKNGYDYIGFEIIPEYVEMAYKRINENEDAGGL